MPAPSRLRFLVFGLAVVIGAGCALDPPVRDPGRRDDALRRPGRDDAHRPRGAAIHAGPDLRPRRHAARVTTSPRTASRSGPSDLPEVEASRSRRRSLAALIGADPAEINVAIDSNPGSRFDLVRVAQDVAPDVAALHRRVRQRAAGRRGRRRDAAQLRARARCSPRSSATRARSTAASSSTSRRTATCRTTCSAAPASSRPTRRCCAANTGCRRVERDAAGREIQVVRTDRQPSPGSSVRLTIDTHEQQLAEQTLRWGMKAAGLKRGVVIVMNPQNGEILAMVSLPDVRRQRVQPGDQQRRTTRPCSTNPGRPLVNHAISDVYPPGSTYKLVAGTGVLADGKITTTTKIRTAGYLTLGGMRFRDWNDRGFGMCNIYLRLQPLERHVLLPGRGHARDRSPRLLGQAVRVRLADRHRPARRGRRDGPDEPVEAGHAGAAHLPRRGLSRGDRPGLRRRDPAPAPERVQRPRERRHAATRRTSSARRSVPTGRSRRSSRR